MYVSPVLAESLLDVIPGLGFQSVGSPQLCFVSSTRMSQTYPILICKAQLLKYSRSSPTVPGKRPLTLLTGL